VFGYRADAPIDINDGDGQEAEAGNRLPNLVNPFIE
jgi:hypothetical protein